jgi:hypothetical protein
MDKFNCFYRTVLFFIAAACCLPYAMHAQIEVKAPPKPAQVVISGVTLICKGSETILKVEGDYESFSWNTGSTERLLRVKEEGIYEVTVKTKGGCSISSSVNVQVRLCN